MPARECVDSPSAHHPPEHLVPGENPEPWARPGTPGNTLDNTPDSTLDNTPDNTLD